MSNLLLYYSHTGNCELVANEYLKNGYTVKRIEPKKRLLPNSFFFSVLKGGFLAGVKSKTKIKDLELDFNDFEKIVICSPIWNGNFSSPINTVLKMIKNFDKVSFVFCSGSGEGKKAVKRINKLNDKADVLFLKDPKKYNEELNKLFK